MTGCFPERSLPRKVDAAVAVIRATPGYISHFFGALPDDQDVSLSTSAGFWLKGKSSVETQPGESRAKEGR